MTDELKPVRCGCGGEAVLCESDKYDSFDFTYMIYCKACGISSDVYDTEAEAIQAWNTAMGATDTNVGNKTAKVKWSEVDGCHLCGECGFAVTPKCDVYCAGCGCKLDWSEDE